MHVRPLRTSSHAPSHAPSHSTSPLRSGGVRALTADQLWAVTTMALAAVAVLMVVVGAYGPGAVVSLGAIVVGGWSQLVSETRSERFETVAAVGVAVVALAVCVGA